MNRRLLIIFVCALLAGACASFLVYRWAGAQAQGSAGPRMTDVVVAARDLPIGSLIGAQDIRIAKWAGPLPPGIATSPETVSNRGVIATIYAGEPVMTSRLAAVGSGGGLAAIIPPGMRACAIRVNEIVGLAGFVTPGMRVDVLMAGIPPAGNPAEGPRVRTLLQDIQVLSAGTNLQKDAEGKPQPVQVVNLLVTPEQAERLSLASNQTHIQLVLRNPTDTQVVTPKGSVMSDLFGVAAREPEPQPNAKAEQPKIVAHRKPPPKPQPQAEPLPSEASAPRTRVVEVFNGSARTEAKFKLEEEHK